jgi:hypothetical protein
MLFTRMSVWPVLRRAIDCAPSTAFSLIYQFVVMYRRPWSILSTTHIMISYACASKGYLLPSQIAAQILAFILKAVDGC